MSELDHTRGTTMSTLELFLASPITGQTRADLRQYVSWNKRAKRGDYGQIHMAQDMHNEGRS